MAKRVFNQRLQELDGNGNPYAGAKLFTYDAGSSTKRTTYQDSAASVAHANPIILDAAGRIPAAIWINEGVTLKLVLAPSTDTDPPTSPIWTEDAVPGLNDVTATVDEYAASGLAPTYVSATSFTVAGDHTTELHIGRRLKITDAGGTKYATITDSVFGALTTVTVVNDGAALASPVSAFSWSLLRATNRATPFGGVISPSQVTANQNDYDPSGSGGASVLRISADARRNITGLAKGAHGRQVTIHNVGTFPILFKYEDALSTAANRFAFGHTLSGGHSMSIQYDGTSARWRCTFRDDPAGTLKDFGGGTVPEGQLALDGAAVSRTTYAALFNEWGTTWGAGDGSTTFGLPDSRRRVSVGAGGAGTGTLGNAVGNTGGAETHTLTTPEMPAHNHATSADGRSVGMSTGSSQIFSGPSSASDLVAWSMSNTGGGGAHNNMQPGYVVTKTVVF